ncbi:GNAT family N-acetyltransferase [Pedobacter sp.]|uniref:GNAT family N-acetyltransferase n=1 Tax=Pedobacter sp. TaxID=1411316 RepID=UPI003BACCC67
MNEIKLSLPVVDDYQVVQSIGRETFYEAFASQNPEGVMQEYLSTSFSDKKIKTELANKESQFFIAWDNDLPVGYLKINTGNAQTELLGPDALEIERIYVKATHQGKKIGQLLFDKALEVARQKQKKTVWLGVWEENLKAIRFYEKNGFVAFDKHIFHLGDEAQTDIMMRKTLSN